MAGREPSPRFWHSAVSWGGKVYVRGGSTPKFDTDEGKRELASTIEEYDPTNQVWRQLRTTGTLHPGLSAVACVTFGSHLYAFGGLGRRDLCDTLSQLNLKTFVWTQLSQEAASGPTKKDACGMAHFDGDKLAVIGGYANPSGPIQPGSTFILNERFNRGSGWTNEIHIFDITKGSWSSPLIKGTRPPPCADFTLTSIDNHRAVLYGGCRPPEGKCLDKDIYLFNFNTMEVVRIEGKLGEVWPVVTVGHHAACCLGFNTDHPQLLVTGGRSSQDEPLGGVWLFDFARGKWKEVELHSLPRWGHTVATVSLSAKLEAAVIFGGSPAMYEYGWGRLRTEDFPRLTETVLIRFGYLESEMTWALCRDDDEVLKENIESTVIEHKKPVGTNLAVQQLEEKVPSSRDNVMLQKESHKLRILMIAVTAICFMVLILYQILTLF